jgi:hypothetical protein
VKQGRLGGAITVVLAVTALVGCTQAGPIQSSASKSAATSPTPTPRALTVSKAIQLRDAGELGSNQITLSGFWTERSFGHSCSAPSEQPGELEIYCHDGEWGITERREAIGELTRDHRWVPAAGPHLTPWVPENRQRLLFGRLPLPPVPIVVAGHFDDARAADCTVTARQLCRDRFVLDEVLVFDPSSVPPATPTPTPTPFPSPAPSPLFGKEACSGDVDYAFVGWTTTEDLNIGFDREGHVFAMVTADVIPIGEWVDDPNGSGQMFRWWGQRVCLSEDYNIGQPFNSVPLTFAAINGTGFKEWEDGRHEPGDPP